MMKYRLFVFLTFILSVSFVGAQSSAPQVSDTLRYVDAHSLRVINRAFADTVPLFTRVPDSRWDGVREEIRWGMQCSTGIGIRFRSNSRTIAARYKLRYDFAMSWMAYTGIKGTDLYIFGEDGRWHYLATGRPQRDSVQNIVYTRNLDGKEHEFLINLPLYDGVRFFEVGVRQDATLEYPKVDNPRTEGGKIVFWGTSVMQGGCATRPGMTQTNILQRALGVECCNMGVSGEGKIWKENAELLAGADDVICYVIDPVMNCKYGMIDTMTIDFILTLRRSHPKAAIVMVGGLRFPHVDFDLVEQQFVPKHNVAYYRNYRTLKKMGIKDLYYVEDNGFTGKNEEGTVDGIHLSDIGFQCYADQLEPLLRRIVRKYSNSR